ncbi:hypothetical protein Neosp_001557 [[Neocosmospora] mangrovei]
MESLAEFDGIDLLTFEQILEMDDDEDEHEFSRSIVYGFFEQAEETLVQMEAALRDEDGETHLQADACLDRTRDALAVLKTDYIALEEALRKFYGENAEDD